jgi:RNA polymerase sigma-70 factor (ECF subfamily)
MMQPAVEPVATDDVLAQRAACGVRSAFVTLVERYQQRIYRLAFRMSQNASDAEEITQEAFLHALLGIASFHGDASFGTWLYRIAMNEALMRRRAATRRPTQSLDALLSDRGEGGLDSTVDRDPVAADDDSIDQRRRAKLVHAALGRLDDRHRAALVLRDLEELSAEEAATILEITPEAVRQRAHRARVKLRDDLRPLVGRHAI